MSELPKCQHAHTFLSGTWQADMEARIMCTGCGSDKLLTEEEVAEFDRLNAFNKVAAAKYVSGLIPE